jgi:DeoR/GlpR family transcriptional regulator of sugar metabolism
MMLAEQRRVKILALLQEEGSARVSSLSKTFDVSEPTIRQDLEKLESEGYIAREHGGAYLKSIPQQVGSFSLQKRDNMDKKARIGKKAAEYIQDGDVLILDAGSTVTELAKQLMHKHQLTIVTNALNIALLLGSHPSFEILVTGGEFKAPTLSLTGERAADFFQHLHVDKLFLATGGISPDMELTFPGLNDLPGKQAMIESATDVYLVADSTKIGKPSFASLGGMDLIDYFITDNGISDDDKHTFEQHGVNVILA